VLAVAAGVVAYIALLWVARGELGMVWDEPPDIERVEALRAWFAALVTPPFDWSDAFSRARLEQHWRFTSEAPHEHPPVYALLSLITGEATAWLVGPLRALRLSTVLLFAVTAGVLFRLIRTRWGWLPAAAGLAGLLFNPRLLADAQLVTLDAVVGAFWFLSAAAMLHGCESMRRPWLFGVLFGLTVMSKATGVLAYPALLIWAVLYRPRGAWRQLAWAVLIAPAVMLAVNPRWWSSPVPGVGRWAQGLIHYTQKAPIYYLGVVYDSRTTFLPWHNAVVLTAIMVPIGLLVLAALGLAATVRAAVSGEACLPEQPPVGQGTDSPLSDRLVAGWAAINFLLLLVLRVFPFLPAHDGLRQLAPAFFFLPVLVAFGARVLTRSAGPARLALGVGVVLVCLASAAWESVRIHPYELAYYNALIGGPKGAKAAGMESTYYWDAANDEVLGWMNAHLPRRATVMIYPPPDVRIFARQQRWGRLRRDLLFLNLDAPNFTKRLEETTGRCFLIFQLRQGLYYPIPPSDPSFYVRLADSPALYELAPARVGIRLLAIFDEHQFLAALRGEGRTHHNR
jgi:hypothetical protein